MDSTACIFNFYVQGPPGPGGLPGDPGEVGPPVSSLFALNLWFYCVHICSHDSMDKKKEISGWSDLRENSMYSYAITSQKDVDANRKNSCMA